MKTNRFLTGLFCCFFCLFTHLYGYSQGPDRPFSGTYILDSDGVKVTLVLKQDANQQVTGTLSSTTGISTFH